MANRVIDTNVVLEIWHGRGPSRQSVRSESAADAAALAWLKENPKDMIATPVKLEFLGGTNSKKRNSASPTASSPTSRYWTTAKFLPRTGGRPNEPPAGSGGRAVSGTRWTA